MKPMTKITLAALLAVLLAALLGGCANTELAAGFDRAQVTDQAKQVVALLSERDYEAVSALVREDLRAQLSATMLQSNLDEPIQAKGAFTEYGNITVIGQSQDGVDYAVAIVLAQYENGSATYTLSFDTGMALVGLYMK